MLAKVLSATVIGLESVPVEVEVDIASMGLPSFTIVGLPDKAVEEAKERVRSAIKNAGADFPAKRITVNLAPSDIPKEGTHFDLPIAVGILIASEQLDADMRQALWLGELSLNGDVRPVRGVLPMMYVAKDTGLATIFVPYDNAAEAAIVAALLTKTRGSRLTVLPVKTLVDIVHHYTGQTPITPHRFDRKKSPFAETIYEVDMADIKGQEKAKRAAEICAAGGHNLSMQGSPGTGKTMLARALLSILPRMTVAEMLEVTKIYSVCGLLPPKQALITERPFRSPHHTISQIGIVGGGSKPKPGEISLAHRGILFLDEFPQFSRGCIESLRAPIEDGETTIVRAQQALTFPSKFMLISAQNPCPCGYFGDNTRTCTCSSAQVIKYQRRISGPIADRIDLHIDVPKVALDKLASDAQAETSAVIRLRVQAARNDQTRRFAKTKFTCNAEMNTPAIRQYCQIDDATKKLLVVAVDKLKLTARAYHRILKIARTIADLAGEQAILRAHVAEALQYRQRDSTA